MKKILLFFICCLVTVCFVCFQKSWQETNSTIPLSHRPKSKRILGTRLAQIVFFWGWIETTGSLSNLLYIIYFLTKRVSSMLRSLNSCLPEFCLSFLFHKHILKQTLFPELGLFPKLNNPPTDIKWINPYIFDRVMTLCPFNEMQAGENNGYFSNNLVNCGFFSQNKVEKICLISWGRF